MHTFVHLTLTLNDQYERFIDNLLDKLLITDFL